MNNILIIFMGISFILGLLEGYLIDLVWNKFNPDKFEK